MSDVTDADRDVIDRCDSFASISRTLSQRRFAGELIAAHRIAAERAAVEKVVKRLRELCRGEQQMLNASQSTGNSSDARIRSYAVDLLTDVVAILEREGAKLEAVREAVR